MTERLNVFTAIEREGGKSDWFVKVGSAWINRDKSINVVLDALPVNGRLHIREQPAQSEDTPD